MTMCDMLTGWSLRFNQDDEDLIGNADAILSQLKSDLSNQKSLKLERKMELITKQKRTQDQIDRFSLQKINLRGELKQIQQLHQDKDNQISFAKSRVTEIEEQVTKATANIETTKKKAATADGIKVGGCVVG